MTIPFQYFTPDVVTIPNLDNLQKYCFGCLKNDRVRSPIPGYARISDPNIRISNITIVTVRTGGLGLSTRVHDACI